MLSKVIPIFLLFVLTGCASNYEKFYQPRTGINPKDLVRATSESEIQVIRVDDLQSSVENFLTKNYEVIGHSGFVGPYEDEEKLKNLAKKVGSPLVVVSTKHSETLTQTLPMYLPQTTTTYHSGGVSTYGTYGTYSGTSTTYGSKVIPVTTTTQRYEHQAVFLMPRNTKPRVGVLFRNLTVEERRQYERNEGVILISVIEGTPAFSANLFQGDLILEFSGAKVRDQQDFLQMIRNLPEGKNSHLIKLLRNGQEKSVNLQIQ